MPFDGKIANVNSSVGQEAAEYKVEPSTRSAPLSAGYRYGWALLLLQM